MELKNNVFEEIQVIPSKELRYRYIQLLEAGASNPDQLKSNLEKLKSMIACFGLPAETNEEKQIDIDQGPTLRGQIWQILVGLKSVDFEEYRSLVAKGPSRAHNIIGEDALRTFPKEVRLKERVPIAKLVRVLNVFQHKIESDGIVNLKIGYIQGLNCLVVPFLFHMPEVEAFFAFYKFIVQRCPRYSGKRLGATDGDDLVSQVLKKIDPSLFDYLEKNSVHLVTYTHPALQSLLTDTPPLDEVWKLWDLMLAFGVHLIVLFVASMLIIRREEILSTVFALSSTRISPLGGTQRESPGN